MTPPHRPASLHWWTPSERFRGRPIGGATVRPPAMRHGGINSRVTKEGTLLPSQEAGHRNGHKLGLLRYVGPSPCRE
jgi:hypothetical protein